LLLLHQKPVAEARVDLLFTLLLLLLLLCIQMWEENWQRLLWSTSCAWGKNACTKLTHTAFPLYDCRMAVWLASVQSFDLIISRQAHSGTPQCEEKLTFNHLTWWWWWWCFGFLLDLPSLHATRFHF
jgi:hypothetical protein